jgi:hypothetical protein
MDTSTTTLQAFWGLGLPVLLLLSLSPPPTYAQDDGSDLPTVDFAVKAMQSAQFIRTEDGDIDQPSDDAEFGFHRFRYNLEVSAQLHERVSAFVDLGHEPNDFGTGGASFAPAVDYAALDVVLSDDWTFRAGTPVTSLFNFRGYSDGAATQANPLIGNSPIDFITAETGVALVGDLGNAGVDLTVTSPTFFETFEPGTGLSVIAKGRFDATPILRVGAGIGIGTSGAVVDRGNTGADAAFVNWIRADGENYNLPLAGGGGGMPNRVTHAYLLPGASPLMLQADAQLDLDAAVIDVWGGWGQEEYSFGSRTEGGLFIPGAAGSNIVEEDSNMWWLGGTAKFNVTPRFYIAGRGSVAANASDWAEDLDDTSLWRVQGGFGITLFDRALLKLEVVHQNEGENSPGQIRENWTGALTELSVGF